MYGIDEKLWRDNIMLPHQLNGKIDKVSYVMFSIETEESYAKGFLDESRRKEEENRTGKVHFYCSHIPQCNSISIKVDNFTCGKIINEKYKELKEEYGDRLSERICLT